MLVNVVPGHPECEFGLAESVNVGVVPEIVIFALLISKKMLTLIVLQLVA